MTAIPTEKPALPQATSLTRDDLGRLSREAPPWVFLPIIDQAVAQAPGDLGLALLGVRTLAKLGLRTPALERLAALGPALTGAPGAEALQAGVEALPADLVPLSRRLKMAERNIETLAHRGIDLRDDFATWSRQESAWEHLRAAGGNVVRRPAGSMSSLDWLWVGDLHDGMTAFVVKTLDGIDQEQCPQITIEGINPPWLLLAMNERTGPNKFGYAPRLSFLQEDVNEFFEGASITDLRQCLAQPRLRCFIGPDASRRYERDALGRLDQQLGGIGMTSSTVRRKCEPALADVIRSFSDTQKTETDRLHEQVDEIYSPRTLAWWSERFARATAPGSAEPLRVLIPTCRFTTYVQHAARSLRDAMERLGCEVEFLIEADDNASISEWAYLHCFESFRPDLVVLINYTRSGRGRRVPENVPTICWTQDSMGHLFSDRTGAAQGALDFVVGHVYESLLTEFGLRQDRALRFPVVADDRVFEPTEFSIASSQRFDSEIAYVSHHSETPEAMLARLIDEDGQGRNERLLRTLDEQIRALLASANHSAFRQPLRRVVEAEVERAIGGPDIAQIAARTFHQFAIPLAERMIRHEMLRWTMNIAARRGWRLALYGKGWEERPEFGSVAHGPMNHGSALRDCYERSAVQLHASVCNPAHQRVQECALSGGLPLSRITRDALQVEYEIMRLGVMGRIEPCASDEDKGLVGFRIADDPDLLAIAAQLERLGMSMEPGPDPALLWIEQSEWERREAATAIPMIDTRTRWLFGDYSQCAFTDEAGLERLIERAIEQPTWRRSVIDGIASRVRDRLTIDSVAQRMVRFVKDGIDEAATAEAAA